jgi:hypothetical protein
MHFHRYKKQLEVLFLQNTATADYTETCKCGKRRLHLISTKAIPNYGIGMSATNQKESRG